MDEKVADALSRRRRLRNFEKPVDDLIYSFFTRDFIVQVVDPNRARDVRQGLQRGILIHAPYVSVMPMRWIDQASHRFTSLNEHQQVRTLDNSYVILAHARLL